MGLVKTGWRRGQSPRPTGRGRKCCQCGNVASSNVANFQSGAGVWRGENRFGILLGERKTDMATKCRHCGSTSYGHGCAYGRNLLPCCV